MAAVGAGDLAVAAAVVVVAAGPAGALPALLLAMHPQQLSPAVAVMAAMIEYEALLANLHRPVQQ